MVRQTQVGGRFDLLNILIFIISISVSVQYLVARETADDVIWPMIQSKLSVLNKAGLSKDNFEESESKVLEDTRPNKIKDCFNAQTIQEDMEALLADLMEDDFNDDDSPPKKIKL